MDDPQTHTSEFATAARPTRLLLLGLLALTVGSSLWVAAEALLRTSPAPTPVSAILCLSAAVVLQATIPFVPTRRWRSVLVVASVASIVGFFVAR